MMSCPDFQGGSINILAPSYQDLNENVHSVFQEFSACYVVIVYTCTYKVYGGREERVSFLHGSAKVVLLAIVRLANLLVMCVYTHTHTHTHLHVHTHTRATSNFAVLVFKVIAYLYTGSAAMLSEAIHSLADMLNQVHLDTYSLLNNHHICVLYSSTNSSISYTL